MTKGSLTETQKICLIPFLVRSSAFATYPGRWVLEQPGVNAPGTPKMINLPSLHTSDKLTLLLGAPSYKSTEGIASPAYEICKKIIIEYTVRRTIFFK